MSLIFWCGAEGRFGARLGGTNSSPRVPGNCNASGPEIDFPLIVGVRPEVSDEVADEGEVSAPEDELMELMVSFTAPGAISFLGIDLLVPDESIRVGIDGLLVSEDSLVSVSFLVLESCDDLGVVILFTVSTCLAELVMGGLTVDSLRVGATKPPADAERELLLSLISDCELLLEVVVFLPFGASPRRNLSPVDWAFPFMLDPLGEFACCTRVSSLPIAGDALVDEDLVPF